MKYRIKCEVGVRVRVKGGREEKNERERARAKMKKYHTKCEVGVSTSDDSRIKWRNLPRPLKRHPPLLPGLQGDHRRPPLLVHPLPRYPRVT